MTNKQYPIRKYNDITEIIIDGDLPNQVRVNALSTYDKMIDQKNKYALFNVSKIINSYVQNQAKVKNEVSRNY